MIQLLASLFFVAVGGFAILVMIGMVRTNSGAVQSALLGHGAFPKGPIAVAALPFAKTAPRAHRQARPSSFTRFAGVSRVAA